MYWKTDLDAGTITAFKIYENYEFFAAVFVGSNTETLTDGVESVTAYQGYLVGLGKNFDSSMGYPTSVSQSYNSLLI